ncbi:MAG: acetyl-CoA decarbonylase/synthase complex subunit delta [Candidatus Aquicultorales bacterium]
MAFAEPKETYSGKVREVALGGLKVGGETTLPFYLFEGEMANRPIIAMDVQDEAPGGWPSSLTDQLGDVSDPAAWAVRCKEAGADAICLRLVSADPNGTDASPEEAVKAVEAVSAAVDLPLIVYGCGNAEKDAEVLKKVAEATQGKDITIGPAVEENYKPVAAAAMGFGQIVAGETPIDVNMAKQLNILMTNLGLTPEKILIDPSVGALGYGLEYAYSVIERDRLAALTQNDSMMQMPIICNLAKEVWKTKEAKVGEEEEPLWGDPAKRGILWEALTATAFLVSGADILVMAHPEAVRLVKGLMADLGLEG